MGTASVIAVVLGGVLVLAILVATATIVSSGLHRAGEAVGELGGRLAEAERRMSSIQSEVATIAGEVAEVADAAQRRRVPSRGDGRPDPSASTPVRDPASGSQTEGSPHRA